MPTRASPHRAKSGLHNRFFPPANYSPSFSFFPPPKWRRQTWPKNGAVAPRVSMGRKQLGESGGRAKFADCKEKCPLDLATCLLPSTNPVSILPLTFGESRSERKRAAGEGFFCKGGKTRWRRRRLPSLLFSPASVQRKEKEEKRRLKIDLASSLPFYSLPSMSMSTDGRGKEKQALKSDKNTMTRKK